MNEMIYTTRKRERTTFVKVNVKAAKNHYDTYDTMVGKSFVNHLIILIILIIELKGICIFSLFLVIVLVDEKD